jgi:TPP-dependent pyruvate/acetoin dehydrogenase alpha subunit
MEFEIYRNLILLPLICTFLQSSSSSSSDSCNDRKKEFKKVTKSLKQLTNLTKRLIKKKLVSVENLQVLRSTITEARKDLKDVSKSSKKQKSSAAKLSLKDKNSRHLCEKMQQVKMPIL